MNSILNMPKTKRILDRFRKNGLTYKMLDRNEVVVLFELFIGNARVGFEVSKITVVPEGDRFGMHFPETETIPTNERFGYEGSKSFFPNDANRAYEYFGELTAKLKMPNLMSGKANHLRSYLRWTHTLFCEQLLKAVDSDINSRSGSAKFTNK